MCSVLTPVLILWALLGAAWSDTDLRFPPGFTFGVATAAYQIEGAWNVSDKSESVWDRLTHTHPEYVLNHKTGDVACDSYHNWRRDIEMVVELGVQFYRFSISWSRLLPEAVTSRVSEDGKRYYSELIDGLLEKGIEPVVTLFHYDLPQRIQDLGGWTNPLTADWFANYARIAFTLFGDRVNTWITVNEVMMVCDMSYNLEGMVPGYLDEDLSPYLCNKHMVLAHAKAYRIYDEEFRTKYQNRGRLSLATHLMWMEPLTTKDEELAELLRFNVLRSAHPVFAKEGGWPKAVEKIIAEKSKKMGYPQSRLPAFTPDEINFIKGTYDFFGVNYYTSRLVRQARPGDHLRPWPFADCKDLDAVVEIHPSWSQGATSWFYENPEGIRKQLAWLKKQYGDINFIISENGYASKTGLNDTKRIHYFKEHLKQVLLSIKEDGVNVTAFTAWSLMDNFEWKDGYSVKFGLYEMDEVSERKRTARASAKYYASVVAAHSLDVPDNIVVEIHPAVSSEKKTGIYDYGGQIIFYVMTFFIVVSALAIFIRIYQMQRDKRKTRKLSYVSVKVSDLNEVN